MQSDPGVFSVQGQELDGVNTKAPCGVHNVGTAHEDKVGIARSWDADV
jgi:hypothetical protein